MSALVHPLFSASISHPHRPGLQDASQTYSFAALQTLCNRMQQWLRQLPIGDRSSLALAFAPDLAWMALFHAAAQMNLPLLVPPPHAGDSEMTAWLATLPEPQPLWVVQPQSSWHRCLQRHDQPRWVAPPALDTLPPAVPLPPPLWQQQRTAVWITTSGSTGIGKWINVSVNQVVLSAFACAMRLGHVDNDTQLLCLPLHHVGGLSVLWRAAFAAIPVYWPGKFTPSVAAHLLGSGKIRLVSLVPTMLEKIMDIHGDKPFPTALRAILLGGAPASARLIERCRCQQIPIRLSWGMSESASQIATSLADTTPVAQHCGPPSCIFAVQSEANTGRLVVVGGGLEQPLCSQDAGYCTPQGEVVITHRLDDVLISGGEKVTLTEIETVLMQHPWVIAALCIKQSVSPWGERPIAAVVLQPALVAAPAVTATLKQWCQTHLQAYKVPDRIYVLERLPFNDVGKPSRRLLQQQLAALSV